MRDCASDTGDPAIVRLPRKPLRPVVLRPHLSAGLPLNSLSTMRASGVRCKGLFYPIRSKVSACSTASGVPHTTTTSPSLNMVSGPGSRPTMPSRRTALTAACEPLSGELGDASAHRPSMRRQDDAVKLFTKCVTVIQELGIRRPESTAAACRSDGCGCRSRCGSRATTGSFSSSSRCDSSMRLASKVSGTTSVAPARLQLLELGVVLGAHQDRHVGAQRAHRRAVCAAPPPGSRT